MAFYPCEPRLVTTANEKPVYRKLDLDYSKHCALRSNTEAESHPNDRRSKWLIRRKGDSALRPADAANIERWRPAQAEVVQPRHSPDGLLGVRL